MKNEQKEFKRKVKRELRTVMSILHEWDPILRPDGEFGAIVHHTPFDEYECLANGILSLYHRGSCEEAVRQFVKKELEGHFGIRKSDKEIVWGTKLIWQSLNTSE